MRSFTAEELERATGFDRRTIAYYVQQGLIPRVGRRGPRTRYPQLVMDRLLCVRRVREAEQAGEVEPVSLSTMRATFGRVAPDQIARVANGLLSVETIFPGEIAMEVFESAQEVRERSAAYAIGPNDDTGRTTTAPAKPSAERADRNDAAREEETALGDALRELQARADSRQREPNSLHRWSRLEISPDIALSVRGATDADAALLESAGEKLRRLIFGRQVRPER